MIIPRPPAVRGKAEAVQAVLTDGLPQGVDLLQLVVVGALLQASLQQLRLLALQVVLLLHLLVPGGWGGVGGGGGHMLHAGYCAAQVGFLLHF